jgi:hypothetical protein
MRALGRAGFISCLGLLFATTVFHPGNPQKRKVAGRATGSTWQALGKPFGPPLASEEVIPLLDFGVSGC